MTAGLEIGTLFAGRYRIVGRIASGAMGAVYEVVHVETDRRRALKVMLPHMADSADLRERFRLESRVTAQVESDFIVDVFDAGVEEDSATPFLVMELLRGEELGKRLKREGRMPVDVAMRFLSQMALALDKTHQASIVHRDLKPSNLFVTDKDDGTQQIKILDFGVAKFIGEGTAGATLSVGTPLYMAPEQAGGIPITAAADVYSFGMIAFTMLVGESYWKYEIGRQISQVALCMLAMLGPEEAATVRARRFGVGLPLAFDPWFKRITSRNASDRFPTIKEAMASLTEALREGVCVVPATAPEGESPVSRRAGPESETRVTPELRTYSATSNEVPFVPRALEATGGALAASAVRTEESSATGGTPKRSLRPVVLGVLGAAALVVVVAGLSSGRGRVSASIQQMPTATPATTFAPAASLSSLPAPVVKPADVTPALAASATQAPSASAAVRAPSSAAAPRAVSPKPAGNSLYRRD